jgi:hypothetical protein
LWEWEAVLKALRCFVPYVPAHPAMFINPMQENAVIFVLIKRITIGIVIIIQ